MKMQHRAQSFHSQIQVLKAVDDRIITANIQRALNQLLSMGQAFIHVETFAGGVELTGWVRKAVQEQLAVVLATEVQGVSYVVNNLSVRG